MLNFAFYLLEKCKRAVYTTSVFGALLTDLLKAFNSLPHNVIIAIPSTYGFSLLALNPIKNY